MARPFLGNSFMARPFLGNSFMARPFLGDPFMARANVWLFKLSTLKLTAQRLEMH